MEKLCRDLNYEYYLDRQNTPEGEAYFQWLLNKVNGQDMILVCRYLHTRDFYWTVPYDSNREFAGKNLRVDWECRDNFFNDYSHLDSGPASCFEVLVGIAIAMENQLWDPNMPELSKENFFHEMLRNLGLDDIRDHYNIMANIVDKWLDRDYEPNGKGGIFPLDNPFGDQTQIEIWDQMTQYINENYGLDEIMYY